MALASANPGNSPSAPAQSYPGVSEPARVRVLLPLPLDAPYDYLVPEEMQLEAGAVVEVPLGRRRVPGVVWDADPGSSGVAASKLRPVLRRFDVPPIPGSVRRFVDWVAAYYLAPPGAVLKMCLSSASALDPPAPRVAYRLADGVEEKALRITAARQRVLDLLADGPPRTAGDLAQEAAVSPGVVRALAEAGGLEPVALRAEHGFAVPSLEAEGPELSPDQAEAARHLSERVAAGSFSVTLLDGVTGSGKTEVYFEAVRQALTEGRQVLVLLPEIVLSAQWLERFERRFGVAPAQWHSDLTQAQRRTVWRAVAEGKAPVVVGARSALFLPYRELGLIVVDEEHDQAFKQEDGVPYHARDMAVVRARLGGFPCVLASATPSLESIQNVQAGRYDSVHLDERHAGALLPQVEALDMRGDRPPPIAGHGQSFVAPSLRAALAEVLAAGEQAMLFLNRRGYAPLTLCRACGYRIQCPNCTAWLVEHRFAGRLQCHHCGHAIHKPKSCPECHAEDTLAACGPGVERLGEELRALFPDARIAVMASDTLTGPAAAARFVEAVQAHKVDLLIGTQVVAKGHHFPMLTLVGVVDADLGLSGGDLRAGERTYQLLHQVAGRAGRAERPGRVVLQTYEPAHPVIAALVDGARDRFLEAEAESRKEAGMPPFTRLAALILASDDAAAAESAARTLARAAPERAGVEVMGPAPAPLAVLRGRHRWRLLLKTRRDMAPQPILREWLGAVALPSKVRLSVDVDPYNFL